MAEETDFSKMATTQGTKRRAANADPFRLAVLFLGGLIGFCLALLVPVFSTLHDFQADACNPAYRMLGGVLAWISIAALVATVGALIAQLCRYAYRLGRFRNPACVTGMLILLMGTPVIPGAIAVGYCILGGSAILNHDATLPGWRDAVGKLWLF
jgi:hypothetical protein